MLITSHSKDVELIDKFQDIIIEMQISYLTALKNNPNNKALEQSKDRLIRLGEVLEAYDKLWTDNIVLTHKLDKYMRMCDEMADTIKAINHCEHE